MNERELGTKNQPEQWKTLKNGFPIDPSLRKILKHFAPPYTACCVFITNTKEHISGNELAKQGRVRSGGWEGSQCLRFI